MAKASKAVSRATPNDKVVRSTAAVIAAMGGARALTKWFGVSQGAVNQWRRHGIRPGYH